MTLEQAHEAASKAGMLWGGVGGLMGWLASINWLGLAGFAAAVSGALLNAWIIVRRDRREQREAAQRKALHDAQLAEIRRRMGES